MAARLAEEHLYKQVALELANGVVREGLWVKAFANSQGDEEMTKGLYIKYRVQAMIDEGQVTSGIGDIIDTEYLEEEQSTEDDELTTISQDEQDRFYACEEKLDLKGFKISNSQDGWVVTEPDGVTVSFDRLSALELYTQLIDED